jgi:hypothetical protein
VSIIGTRWSTTDFATGGTGPYNTPVLSNQNLTCACTTVNNNCTVPVSVDGQLGGKYYVEFTPVAGVSRAMAFGIIQNSQSRNISPGAALNTTGCAMLTNGGTITINNVNVGAIAAMVNGTVNPMAVDLGAKLIWFRAGAAGNWNNSGTANPATGVGGLSISALSGLIKLVGWECTFSSPPVTMTLNSGSSAFTGSVPSGFTAGWPSQAALDGMFFNTLF